MEKKEHMKVFNGKAIYNPSGKAGEYSYWACNFYNGCSNGCTYCYLKNGALAHTLGGDKPTLKKCFKDENHAIEVFIKELKANLHELQKHGLFFTFTSDPLIMETIHLTTQALVLCMYYKIPVKLLTKSALFIDGYVHENSGIYDYFEIFKNFKDYVAFGFTLTGHDELEPNASPNAERIEAMRKLHDAGFKTWASIEPIIDFESSKNMIDESFQYCDLFKVGLESGRKYEKKDLVEFIEWNLCIPVFYEEKVKFYFKDSLLKQAGISRSELPSNCVGRDYNMFSQ
jgi:DNA repair photolyase